VTSKEDEEFPSYPTQGVEGVQEVSTSQEVSLTNEASNYVVEEGESREGCQAWVVVSFIARWLDIDLVVYEPIYL
jgi:hypothetical protein